MCYYYLMSEALKTMRNAAIGGGAGFGGGFAIEALVHGLAESAFPGPDRPEFYIAPIALALIFSLAAGLPRSPGRRVN